MADDAKKLVVPDLAASTQRDAADAIMKSIVAISAPIASLPALMGPLLEKLDAILAASQDGPPSGKADGSISPAKWFCYRDYSMACRRLLMSVQAIQK